MALVVAALLAGALGEAAADEASVPVPLQVDLLSKVVAYDRNLPKRAGGKVVTLVVTKPGSDESRGVGAQAKAALAGKETLAELPHEVIAVSFAGAPALAAACKEHKASLVYVAPGFSDEEIAALAQALEEQELMTVAARVRYVEKGLMLGFDLVGGKPKLVFSLKQASRQGVSLSAKVLALMTVLQ